MRDDDTVGGEVEAPVALVIGRIANENAQRRTRGEFVRSGGGEVGVAGAPESPKVMVGGESAIESEKRSAHVQGLGWETIDEEGGGGKGIGPVGGGMDAWKSKVRVTLLTVRSMRSALPFCCGV